MQEIFIKRTDSIKTALKKLDITAEKVLLVVDDDEKVIGTLSDGDVRRAVLEGRGTEEDIDPYYCRDYKFFKENDFDTKKAEEVFLRYKISLIPIINNKGRLSRLLKWDEFFSKDNKVFPWRGTKLNLPVVIMAGGKGNRMSPFTQVLPKPLIPIGEKTIIEHIIDEFMRFGISSYYLTLNYKGEMIRAYFDGIKKNYSVGFVWEESFLGTAGSLRFMQSNIPDTLIVSNCDIIVRAEYDNVLEYHRENKGKLTILSSIQHHRIPYGVVEFKNGGEVTSIKEKPEYTFPINTGVYVLEKECLSLIPENTVFHMTDLIDLLIKRGERVLTYPVNERDYTDIGQWEEYRKTVFEYRQKTENISEEL